MPRRGDLTAPSSNFDSVFETPLQAALPRRNETSHQASSSWARCMKRIFNVDPLLCPRCGETMRIKAFIRDSREIALESASLYGSYPPRSLNASSRNIIVRTMAIHIDLTALREIFPSYFLITSSPINIVPMASSIYSGPVTALPFMSARRLESK